MLTIAQLASWTRPLPAQFGLYCFTKLLLGYVEPFVAVLVLPQVPSRALAFLLQGHRFKILRASSFMRVPRTPYWEYSYGIARRTLLFESSRDPLLFYWSLLFCDRVLIAAQWSILPSILVEMQIDQLVIDRWKVCLWDRWWRVTMSPWIYDEFSHSTCTCSSCPWALRVWGE